MRRLFLIISTAYFAAVSLGQAAAGAVEFHYQNFGRPGTVDRRQKVEELNLTLVTFSNGVRLNIRPSTTEPSRFRLRVVFPINATHAGNYPLMAFRAMRAVFLTNLEHNTHEEIFALLQQHQLSVEFRVDQGTPRLLMVGPESGLPFALRLLSAWLSDPIGRLTPLPADIPFPFDPALAVLSSPMPSYYEVPANSRKFSLVPQDPSRLALWRALRVATNDARLGHHGTERGARWEQAVAWINEHMLRAPIEVGLVGDLEVDQIITDAAANLGALPKRKSISPEPPLSRPKQSVRLEEVEPDISPAVSMSCLLWPYATREEPAPTAAVTVACAALHDVLVVITGQILPKPLEPRLWIHRDPVQRDLAFVVMQNELTPPTAGRLTGAIFRTVTKFANAGLSEDDFNRIREKVRQQRVADLTDNQWWLDNVLWAAQTNPQLIAEAREHISAVDHLQLADANAAAKVFSPQLATAVILTGGQKETPAKK